MSSASCSFRISRAAITGNVFIASAGAALFCNFSLLAWRLLDSDSTRLYTSERRVPRCMPNVSPDYALQWISSKPVECGSCSCCSFLLKASALLFAFPERYLVFNWNCANSAAHLISVAPNLADVCRYDNGLLSVYTDNSDPGK